MCEFCDPLRRRLGELAERHRQTLRGADAALARSGRGVAVAVAIGRRIDALGEGPLSEGRVARAESLMSRMRRIDQRVKQLNAAAGAAIDQAHAMASEMRSIVRQVTGH